MIAVLLYNNLSERILQDYCKNQKIFLVESYALYSGHHKKKLAFFISAMRHFYEENKHKFNIEYVKTDKHPVELFSKYEEEVLIFEPADHDLLESFRSICNLKIIEDPDFICSKEEFSKLNPKIMETFYRKMRLKTGFLMNGKEPIGNKWNFDSSNRKPIPSQVVPPTRPEFGLDEITLETIELVETKFANNFGDVYPFYFAINRSQALEVLDHFVRNSLPSFGNYQDAMKTGENFLFHSVLAPYLNIGLLSPAEVCIAAERAFLSQGSTEGAGEMAVLTRSSGFEKKNPEPLKKDEKNFKNQPSKGIEPSALISIENVEGFIRQIIGWREFIRGVYWLQMPKYIELNHLNAKQKLPDFYWTCETELNCLRECISQTKEAAYSHHIQRLMVTGNFAMLIGSDPKEVHEWYLKVYADAHEWVELPNTIGMSLHADGGIVGTKPYACSANYINKMSDFCKACKYNAKEKFGQNACPFNYLYWDFLMRHDFSKNPRMFAAYAGLSKINKEDKEKIKQQSKGFIAKIFKN